MRYDDGRMEWGQLLLEWNGSLFGMDWVIQEWNGDIARNGMGTLTHDESHSDIFRF